MKRPRQSQAFDASARLGLVLLAFAAGYAIMLLAPLRTPRNPALARGQPGPAATDRKG